MSKYSGYLLLLDSSLTTQAINTHLLNQAGYTVKSAYTLSKAWEIIDEELPRCIILDIFFRDGNGLVFLREFRRWWNVPVMILTSMSKPEDIIKGINSGGDVYLTKPYDKEVFTAYVKSLLLKTTVIPDVLEYGEFKLYPSAGIALLNGKDMVLSFKEYAILQLLVQQLIADNPEEALSAELLYNKVWRQKMVDNRNSVKQAVRKLREKLVDSMYTVGNIRGEGYFLEER